ncbi:MAG: hypothetical protein ACK5MK_07015 [Dysgonomonas sp.]
MEYAENYKYLYNKKGDIIEECTLEVDEIDESQLFDMQANYIMLDAFKNYISETVASEYQSYLNHAENADTRSKRKMFLNFANKTLKMRAKELEFYISKRQFQDISDFENQHRLVAEIKALGFSGYQTEKEVAIF